MKKCPTSQRVTRDAQCTPCPEYQIQSSTDSKQCKDADCPGLRDIVKKDGTCQQCPIFSIKKVVLNKNQSKECMSWCDERSIVMKSQFVSFLCEKCDSHQRAQEDGTVCGPDKCTEFQKIMPDGRCSDCEPGFRPAKDGIRCVKPCTDLQMLNMDDSCTDCAPYTKVQKTRDGDRCDPDKCESW